MDSSSKYIIFLLFKLYTFLKIFSANIRQTLINWPVSCNGTWKTNMNSLIICVNFITKSKRNPHKQRHHGIGLKLTPSHSMPAVSPCVILPSTSSTLRVQNRLVLNKVATKKGKPFGCGQTHIGSTKKSEMNCHNNSITLSKAQCINNESKVGSQWW